MRVLVMIASSLENTGGIRSLRTGDRAAVHWGVRFAGNYCQARCLEGDRSAFVYAISSGASCAIWNEDDISPVDLVLIGSGTIETLGDTFAGQLAEQLSAELVFDVLELSPSGERWRVLCDAGRGARDRWEIAGPVVAVVSDLTERPPYVSRYRLMQAERSLPPLEVTLMSGRGWQPASPRPPRVSRILSENAEQRANAAFGIEADSRLSQTRQIVSEEPAICAQVLLRYLVHHGFVDRKLQDQIATPVVHPDRDLSARPASRSAATSGRSITAPMQRGPRQEGDAEQRIGRRPRLLNAVVPASNSVVQRLQRGPRRLTSGAISGQRGPFPVSHEFLT